MRSAKPMWLLTSALAAGAMALAVVATGHGPGLSPDSASYLSTARNLAARGDLLAFNGVELTFFPPGLSTVLAGFVRGGIDAVDAARWVNVLALGAIVVLSHLLLRRHVRSTLVLGLSTGLVAASPVLLAHASMALSEPLFIVATLVALLLLEDVLESGATRLPILFPSAVLAWIAFMLRYAGLALVVTGFLVVLAARVRTGAKGRAAAAACAYAAAAVSVPALWMARNLLEGTDPLGNRAGGSTGLWSNTRDAVRVVSRWLIPDRIPTVVGSVAVLVAVVTIGLTIWRASRGNDGDRAAAWALFPVVAFAVISGGTMLVASLAAVEHLNERYLAPLLVPLVVLVAWTVDRLSAARRTRVNPTTMVAVGALALWILVSVAHSVSIADDRARTGVGFASTAWDRSELAVRAARAPARSLVFSNDHYALYLLTGRQPVLASPRSVPGLPVEELEDVRHLVRRSCEGGVLLAWFESDPGRTQIAARVGLDDLRTVLSLETVATVDDGQLFRVEPRRGSTDCPSP